MLNLVFLVISSLFFVYSYGFVDLNLTLSSHPLIFDTVTNLQKLVYFNRPLSTYVYLGFIVLFFLLYCGMLVYWHIHKLSYFPWKFFVVIGCIFALSYPALSSDVYKYLFSARMIIEYGANPHLVTPDTFAADTWIRFMRWVHTPSPYGPAFTLYTIPFYVIGLGKFVPTLYLYKIAQVGWYLLSIWLIGKLSKSVRAQLFFALNPLILIEWLGGAHNDAPMMTLLLLSIYLVSRGRRALGLGTLAVSAGIKYITGIFAPFIFLSKYNQRLTHYFLLTCFFLAPLLYKYSFQYQPWYVTWLVPFAAILGNTSIMWIVGAYTLGSLLRYIPFVATSLWSATPLEFALYSFLPPVVTIVAIFIKKTIFSKMTVEDKVRVESKIILSQSNRARRIKQVK